MWADDKLLPALVLALLASLAGNVLLARAYLDQRDHATVAISDAGHVAAERDGARSAAQACSDGVDSLAGAAAQREATAAPARAGAAGQATALNARADYTLSRPLPAGEACAGLQALGDDWLQERAKP